MAEQNMLANSPLDSLDVRPPELSFNGLDVRLPATSQKIVKYHGILSKPDYTSDLYDKQKTYLSHIRAIQANLNELQS